MYPNWKKREKCVLLIRRRKMVAEGWNKVIRITHGHST